MKSMQNTTNTDDKECTCTLFIQRTYKEVPIIQVSEFWNELSTVAVVRLCFVG